MKRNFITLCILVMFPLVFFAQNTAITDNETYDAHSSAMLDVYSTTKGVLLPRLTTDEMNAIETPAAGLMVYNSGSYQYYFYTGTNWLPVSGVEYFQTKGDTVFITGDGMRMGVGDASPMSRLSVKGDPTAISGEPLFEVKNSTGDVIFAVYEDEVKVNFIETAKGNKGGFAVGGLSPGKGVINEYLRITPDSVRVYVKDDIAKGNKGGFAVGGLSPGKGFSDTYFSVQRDSTRVYVNDVVTKGNKGGFAVGGLSPGKGMTDTYLSIQRDSARIYVDNSTKGNKGGFAVGGLSPGKSGINTFLDLTPDNYFIGHQAGANTVPGTGNDGRYNSFFGYEAGMNNETGYQNIFVGYNAGKGNVFGFWNTFLGVEAGVVNTGSDNTFIGYRAGSAHQNQGGNVYLGSKAGENATNGEQNVYIGESAGTSTTYGKRNVFIGFRSGFSTTGDPDMLSPFGNHNVFLGTLSGEGNTTGYKNIFIGNKSGMLNIDGFQNIFIGDSAGYANSAGVGNVYMGVAAGADNTTGLQNIFIGNYAGAKNTIGMRNIFIGRGAGEFATGLNTFNVAIGVSAGRNLTASSGVTIIGNETAMNSYDIDRSTFLGAGTGKNTDAAYDNTFIGFQSGNQNISGMHNTYVGSQSGIDAGGMQNVYMGYNAGATNADGGGNVFIGCGSGQDGTSGANNVYVGFMAGEDNSGSGNVFIGNQVAQSQTAVNNKLYIDNNPTEPPLIYGEFDNGLVRITGENTVSTNKIFDVTGGGSSRFYVQHNGWVVAPVAASLNVGAAAANLAINTDGVIGTQGSSIRYKKNVVDMKDISWLYKLRPVNFLYKTDSTKTMQYGLIAEEVEKIEKSFVFYNKDGEVETVMYQNLIAPLLKATQDQKKVIEVLKQENEDLKIRLQNIEERLLKVE